MTITTVLVGTKRKHHDLTDDEADELQELADRLRAVFEDVGSGDLDSAAHRVNRLLHDTAAHPLLIKHDGEPWHIHFHGTSESYANDWAAGMSTALAVVLGSEYHDRLGVCTAPSCDRVFVDTSRNGTRRFCSKPCQNRVKTAAFRAREKARRLGSMWSLWWCAWRPVKLERRWRLTRQTRPAVSALPKGPSLPPSKTALPLIHLDAASMSQ